MSCGAHDYAYLKVLAFIDSMMVETCEDVDDRGLRLAFADHLHKVAEAMRVVELVDSGGCVQSAERAPIRACVTPEQELSEAMVRERVAMRFREEAERRLETKLLIEAMHMLYKCQSRAREHGFMDYTVPKNLASRISDYLGGDLDELESLPMLMTYTSNFKGGLL